MAEKPTGGRSLRRCGGRVLAGPRWDAGQKEHPRKAGGIWTEPGADLMQLPQGCCLGCDRCAPGTWADSTWGGAGVGEGRTGTLAPEHLLKR